MLFEAIFIAPGETPYDKSILEKNGIAKYYLDWGKPTDIGYMAKLENEKIGAIWSRQFTTDNKGYAYINDQTPEMGIAIFPNYRNKGIGSKLLDKLFSSLQAKNIKAVSLSVDSRNPAVRLYNRSGFKVVQKESNSVTMRLKL